MYCKNCGTRFEGSNDAYCARCGAPRGQGNNYCDQCGSPMAPGQIYCNTCGRTANGYAGGYQQPVHVPIEYKNIAVCIILCFVTCGFYQFYWFVKVTEDANALSGDYKTSGGMALLLTLITCGLYGFYWAYHQGEKLDYAKRSRGIPSSNSGIIYLILELLKLSIVGVALMQNEINQFAAAE